MRKHALTAAVLAGLVAAGAEGARPPVGPRAAPRGLFEPDEMIVRFAPRADGTARPLAEQQAALGPVLGATIKRQFKIVPGLCVVRLPAGGSATEAAAALAKSADILYAEPNYKVRAISNVPDDPRFTELWGMDNTGQTGGVSDADIDAPEAWSIHTGGDNVIVAIIDTGIDYTHPDLAANMWVNPGEIAGNAVDDDANGFVDDIHGYDFVNGDGDPIDDQDHGTHVAGTVGAVGDNAEGVAGVCWTVRLMALKFLGADGSGDTAGAIASIEYAVQMGARVLSNSWGSLSFSEALRDTIAAAGGTGVLFVAAAGNESLDTDGEVGHYPSGYDLPSIISVMATDHTDARSWFSNFGLTTVDLGAPGSDILSCKRGGGYVSFNGTSMATPHVAGACALVWSANPDLPAQTLKETLLQTADPMLPGECVSGGRLNLHELLLQTASPLGRVTLPRGAFSCSDSLEVNLSDIDLRGIGAQAVAVTASGGDAETVTLTETPPGTGYFAGSISTAVGVVVQEDGTLQVSDGQSLTVTYEDGDDGNGVPATITAIAVVDCVPPVLSNVNVASIPAPGVVTFETDEPTRARVRAGLSCGGPYDVMNEEATLATSHTVTLNGLAPETTYALVVDAFDEAGNLTTDDNSGACYAITTPALIVPDAYSTIQSAVDAAPAGATVTVLDGVYAGPGNHGIDFGGKAVTLRSANGPASTIIDGEGQARGFYFHSGEGPGTRVEGFTVRNGFANEYSWGGGAIQCTNASSPTLVDCTLTGNAAAVFGSGVYCSNGSSPTFERCRLVDNAPGDFFWSGASGGGIACDAHCSPTLTNCRITGNSAYTGGGVLCFDSSSPTLTNCLIAENTSIDAGGIWCDLASSPTLVHCTVAANVAQFYYNVGGIRVFGPDSDPTLVNTIVWNNPPEEINASSIDVRYSTVAGGWPGEGNLDADPAFALPGDYHLLLSSPCIDAGTNDPPGGLPSVDLDDRPRAVDGDGDVEPWSGQSETADTGVYEADPAVPALAVAPVKLEFVARGGTEPPPDQVFSVRNYSGGVLSWQITESCDWLAAAPASGDSSGEIDEVTLSVDATGLSFGEHACVVTVSSPEAVNSPVRVQVVLLVAQTLRVPSEHATIQDAIDASSDGDVVLVADGTYTGPGNRDLEFSHGLVEGRTRAITVRSENGPDHTVIDAEGAGRGFYFRRGETPASVVEGFTILNGTGNINEGGGILCQFASNPTIRNCRITACHAARGGAISCRGSSPTIIDCEITGNTSDGRGGGIYSFDAGPILVNCVISRNEALTDGGGGVHVQAGAPTLIGCLLAGNHCGKSGGALRLTGGEMTLANCTVFGNAADLEGGGAFVELFGQARLVGCIFYYNRAFNTVMDEDAQIDTNTPPVVDYTCLQGWSGIWEGVGNTGQNPMFADFDGADDELGTADDDLHLTVGSPCINAGDPAFFAAPGSPEALDVEGLDRVQQCRVDMGAVESPLFTDCDGNGVADACDIVESQAPDCNLDGVPDLCHVISTSRILVSSWGNDRVLAFDGDSGAPLGEFITGGALHRPNGIILRGSKAYVASGADHQVLEFWARTGVLSRTLVKEGLNHPTGLAVNAPNLYVANWGDDSVRQYDLATGAFLDTVVEPGTPDVVDPAGLLWTDGALLVASHGTNQVLAYNVSTGAFVVAAEGGGLDGPAGMVRDAQGNLLVASSRNHAVLKYAPDGSFLGPFVGPGSAGLADPVGLAWGPNGNLLVVSRARSQVLEYRRSDGAPVDHNPNLPGVQAALIEGGGLDSPTHLAVLHRNECNGNGVPDGCEVEAGTSTDCNENDVPDDCELDTDGDGTINACDADSDDDGVLDDGDESGTAGDNPCTGGATTDCDDNCLLVINPGQEDSNGDGQGDACDMRLFVDHGASGTNDGSSWTDAYTDLQDALTAYAASGDARGEVWVAAGTYRPDRDTGDRSASFRLPAGVVLYGGFAGGETILDERRPALNETVLSGDLDDDDDAGGSPAGVSENSYHVVTGQPDALGGISPILDGFVITGGNANGPEPDDRGGGLYNDGASPVILNCVFRRNRADFGGGAVCNDRHSSPTLINCAMLGNAGGDGGAIRNRINSNAAMINCVFAGNVATGDGGAVRSQISSPAAINCTFAGNVAGGAGGAWSSRNSHSTLANSILWGNLDATGTGPFAQIHADNGTLTVEYCCVQDDVPGDGGAFPGAGNIDVDPGFVREPDDGGDGWRIGDNDDYGDLRLAPVSPCIDAGNDHALPLDAFDLDGDGQSNERVPLDRERQLRFTDDPASLDTGVGVGQLPVVDLGAYEHRPDCNDNGIPDACDLDCGAAGWQCDPDACGGSGDCNLNGIPDECEPDVDDDGRPDVCEVIYGDFDLDGDVDQSDFGVLQRCLTGSSVAVTDPDCVPSDLDLDGKVDAADVHFFHQCMSGEHVPYDPACID